MQNVGFVRISDGMSIDTYDDWELIFAPYTISAPEVQTNFVTVPGRDGELDLSESLGTIKYKNRDLKLEFTSTDSKNDICDKYSMVCGFLHGQRVKVTLPSNTDYYYTGRCKVGSLDRGKNTNQITVDIDCEPYKYKQSVTVVTFDIGELPYNKIIVNDRMDTIPTITTTAAVVMEFENNDYSWNAGEHTNTSIVFKEGNNTLTFKEGSSGSVAVSYQEGAL